MDTEEITHETRVEKILELLEGLSYHRIDVTIQEVFRTIKQDYTLNRVVD